YLYTQPLPPTQPDEGTPAAIVPPSDSHGGSFAAYTGFAGHFFPHTRDWTQADTTSVSAGATSQNINFDVEQRNGPTVYDMNILAYLGPAGKEAYVHAPSLVSGFRGWLVFDAPGTLLGSTAAVRPGLKVNTIGPGARMEQEFLGAFTSGYLYSAGAAHTVPQPTPVALAVTTSDDLYVLPAAITVVPSA